MSKFKVGDRVVLLCVQCVGSKVVDGKIEYVEYSAGTKAVVTDVYDGNGYGDWLQVDNHTTSSGCPALSVCPDACKLVE